MALSAKVGAFNTGTGASDIVVSDVGFQPKAILFWWSGRTGTGDAAGRESHFQGIGAVTATTQRWAITTNDIDAAAAQDANTSKTATGCLLSVDAAGAIDGKADLASFDSGGFTLSVSTAFPRDQRVHYLALGGDDITNAKAGEFTGSTGTVPYNESITDPGFQPDIVFFANRQDSGTTGEVSLATAGVMGFGVAAADGAQGVITLAADGGSTSMDTDGYGYTGECAAGPSTNAGGSVPARASFVSMDANGFTLNRLENAALWARFYLALKGGAYHVGNNVTSVTGSATIATSGYGFAPKAVFVFSAVRPTSTQDAATAPWKHSIGAGTSTSERGAQGTISRDAVADAVVGTAIEHDAVYVSLTDATPPAIDGLMDINSMDSDGVTFIMDDGDGAARRFFYVGFGDAPAADRRAIVTWAEMEVPNAPRRAIVTWAEIEVPNAPRRAVVTWAELEVPDIAGDRRAVVTWAEFEVPDLVVASGGGRRKTKRFEHLDVLLDAQGRIVRVDAQPAPAAPAQQTPRAAPVRRRVTVRRTDGEPVTRNQMLITLAILMEEDMWQE